MLLPFPESCELRWGAVAALLALGLGFDLRPRVCDSCLLSIRQISSEKRAPMLLPHEVQAAIQNGSGVKGVKEGVVGLFWGCLRHVVKPAVHPSCACGLREGRQKKGK